MLSLYFTLIDNQADITKFEQLYNLYKKRMWYVANEILNDAYKAEDAVHNAFMGIAVNMHHIGEVDSKPTFAYVITAAKNAAINLAERDKDKAAIKLDDYKNYPDDKLLNEVISVERKEILISALKQMPEKYRDLLYLHYCIGLSEKELSEQFCKSYATIRKQVSRAKKMLIELLEKEGVSYERL